MTDQKADSRPVSSWWWKCALVGVFIAMAQSHFREKSQLRQEIHHLRMRDPIYRMVFESTQQPTPGGDGTANPDKQPFKSAASIVTPMKRREVQGPMPAKTSH